MSDAARSGWVWEPEVIAGELEALGYDVDRADARLPEGGGSLSARRGRGDRTELLVVDAGGRLRLRVTSVVDERAARLDAAGVRLRVVRQTRAVSTTTGTLTAREQLGPVLAVLDAPTPGASDASALLPAPPDLGEH